LLKGTITLKTQIAKDGEDMKGKFGRILGDFDVYYGPTDSQLPVSKIMIREGHAVPYIGGNKEDLLEAHMANRARLIAEGIVEA
jgi:hypothetical protein